MVGRLTADELWPAFDSVLKSLMNEINYVDPALGFRVSADITALSGRPVFGVISWRFWSRRQASSWTSSAPTKVSMLWMSGSNQRCK